VKLTNKWTRRSWQYTVRGAMWTYMIFALRVALNSALSSASCFTALMETTFAPKPEVALRVYCVAVRSAILATAWLLVTYFTVRGSAQCDVIYITSLCHYSLFNYVLPLPTMTSLNWHRQNLLSLMQFYANYRSVKS